MWAFIFDAIKWVWAERSFLKPIFYKYKDMPSTGSFKFDGAKVKAAIIEYEPFVFDIVKNGTSVQSAVIKIILKKFAPRKMTPQEEKIWFDRGMESGH